MSLRRPSSRQEWMVSSWMVAALAALMVYVLAQPPLARAALALRPAVIAAVAIFACFGFGWPLVRLLTRRPAAIDQALSAVAVGIGMLGLSVFGLALAGVTGPVVGGVLILAGLVLAVGFAPRWWRCLRSVEIVRPANGFDRLGVLALAALAPLTVPFVLAPDVTTDSLEFHLLVPKMFLQAGGIEYLPRFVESNYPSLIEYVFMALLPIGGDVACKSFHFLVALLLLIAIARLSARLSPVSSRWLAPALYLSMPVVMTSSSWAWNDALFTFFLLLALGQLMDLREKGGEGRDRFWLVGILCGLAAATKYTFAMVFLALIPFFLVARFAWRWPWAGLARVSVPVAALSMTWFVRNLVNTGNPFHPFLHRLFRDRHWNDAAAAYFHGTLTRFEMPDWTWTTYLTFPFRISLFPRVIDVHVGVLPLLFAPLLLLSGWSAGGRLLRLYVVCYVAVWLAIQTEVRSFLSVLAVVTVLGVAAVERLLASRNDLRRPVTLVLALALAGNLVIGAVTAGHKFRTLDHFLGLESREDYLLREARNHATYRWLDAEPAVSAVLLVGLHGPYHLGKPALFSSCCDPPVAESIAAAAVDGAEVRHRLQELGVSHVVVNVAEWRHDHDQGLYSWPDADRRAFESFLEDHCRKVAQFGDDWVAEIH